MSNTQQMAERWNYIQGGFTYIDSNGKCETCNTTGLSMAELKFFISSLSNISDADKHNIPEFGIRKSVVFINNNRSIIWKIARYFVTL